MKTDIDRGKVDDALAELWRRSRPQVLRRIEAIESANLALRAGSLDSAERAGAERAAHKLAGVAGTFGYWGATDLAREAEAAFEGCEPITPYVVRRLQEITVALREQLSGEQAV